MLPQWNVKTNYFLGTFNERSTVSIPLPLASTNGVTSSVISGALPRGLRIENNSILGTPVEVIGATQSTFVIRARTSEG